ncbi:MAG: ribosome biogenesis GTPase YlqF [Firmicutes bacterium HGW-Firmicutes-7]|nr:MAG: ribosome biogenesis GTPase YlqF [Firmicutes bacterium HGW-Firmicutes-7]
MNIQWYPGHMTKAKRMMEENVKLVDVVIEMLDARVPLSSRNPEVLKIAKNKPRIVILNKIDLADEEMTRRWAKFLKDEGAAVVLVNARDGKGMNNVMTAAKEVCKEKIQRNLARGIINKPIRAMVVGIPNVGKSTFINKLVGKASAKTGNKPGVTKGKQWIKVKKDFELLDTPGLLWPRFEDQRVGIALALIGSIKEELLDRRELAFKMIDLMRTHYKAQFLQKYKVEDIENKDLMEILEEITRQRHLVKTGNEPDTDRMSIVLLDEFRNGKYGKITIDIFDEIEVN